MRVYGKNRARLLAEEVEEQPGTETRFEPDPMEMGRRLRAAIDERGLSASEFADSAGIGRTSVYRWLEGYTAPGSKSLALAAVRLGISADYLLGIDGRSRR